MRTVRRRQTAPVGIDLGWRLLSDGCLRVALWHDDQGNEGELRLPANMLGRWRHATDLRLVRDVTFNAAIALLRDWLKTNADILPAWLSEHAGTIHSWKSQARLAGLVNRWRAPLAFLATRLSSPSSKASSSSQKGGLGRRTTRAGGSRTSTSMTGSPLSMQTSSTTATTCTVTSQRTCASAIAAATSKILAGPPSQSGQRPRATPTPNRSIRRHAAIKGSLPWAPWPSISWRP